MTTNKLHIYKRPGLYHPRILIGPFGWMDPGCVSTGTTRCLINRLGAGEFAEIELIPLIKG